MNWGIRLGLVALLLVFALGGCGSDDAFVNPGGGGGGAPGDPAAPVVAGIVLLVDPPLLQSAAVNNADGVTVTAIARNADNVVIPDVSLNFMADSGTLAVNNAITDANGRATAILTTGGDSRNRSITVTASSGNVEQTITVDVAGTQLIVAGSQSIESGETETVTATLLDSSDQGIRDITINASSAQGNVFVPTAAVTGVNGRATFELTGNVGGQDTLTFTGADMSVVRTIQVSRDGLSFQAPAAGAEVALGTAATITIQLRREGNPLAGAQVLFSASRGTLSATSATTDANGSASVTLNSSGANGAGPVLVTAMGPGPDNVTRKLSFEFVATTPTSINVQAGPATVSPGGEAAVTAVVRDANNNPVKNQVVRFSLNDISGGQLSGTTDITDSQGIARTSYIASSGSSARDGVVITAAIENPPAPVPTDSVALTVAAPTLFLVLGTDNLVVKNNESATYDKTFNALITDSAGNPAPPHTVFRLTLRSFEYQKGNMIRGAEIWEPSYQVTAGTSPSHFGTPNPNAPPTLGPYFGHPAFGCRSEDPQGTGSITLADDYNNNGQIDPANVAQVPGTVEIDEDGVAAFTIRWPQNYSLWTLVRLTATAVVSGTETVRRLDFVLPIAAADVSLASSPPNVISPFGVASDCADST